VDLEEFSVSAYQPISNTSLRIDFHLFGIVAIEDEADFLQQFEENRHRFREQVLVIARSAELTDLTDAGLGLIKRRILEKSNEALGRPLLRAVVFSDFSFVEQ
jgi:flagellar FliL protein